MEHGSGNVLGCKWAQLRYRVVGFSMVEVMVVMKSFGNEHKKKRNVSSENWKRLIFQ